MVESSASKKKVVIVGAGYGGCQVAKLLDKSFEVTLIERKKLFFHNVASVRAAVDPETAKKIYFSYDSLLKNGKVVYGKVQEISTNQVDLDDGQIFTFDYLIIATGSNVLSPFKTPLDIVNARDIKSYFENIAKQINDSKRITIVGGGAVAVELIGEITNQFGNNNTKEITLVHNGSRLVHPKLNDKFNNIIIKAMKSRNVNVIYNDKIIMPDSIKENLKNQTSIPIQVQTQTYTTEKGVNIESDLIIYTVGNKINNESFTKHFSNVINEIGQIKVNESCQVQGHDNIFAIGDITDFNELKTSYNATYHGTVVSKVIESLSKGKSSPKDLPKHKPSGLMLSVSLGPNDGVTQLPNGWILGSFLTKTVKSKSLFINRFYELLNKPKPISFD